MKSMQRRFGTFQKRSDDQADVGAVLAEFKAADDMIERVSLDIAADYHYSLAYFS
jgi:amphiphysin